MEMREFQLNYVNEFSFTTEWMNDNQDSFDYLRIQTREVAEKYLAFLNVLSNEKGIHIQYYHLDSDEFKDGDVVKWLITFSINEEGFSESLDGLIKTDFYNVVKMDKKEVLFYGGLDQCWKFIDSNFSDFNTGDEESIKELSKVIQVEYHCSDYHIKIK